MPESVRISIKTEGLQKTKSDLTALQNQIQEINRTGVKIKFDPRAIKAIGEFTKAINENKAMLGAIRDAHMGASQGINETSKATQQATKNMANLTQNAKTTAKEGEALTKVVYKTTGAIAKFYENADGSKRRNIKISPKGSAVETFTNDIKKAEQTTKKVWQDYYKNLHGINRTYKSAKESATAFNTAATDKRAWQQYYNNIHGIDREFKSAAKSAEVFGKNTSTELQKYYQNEAKARAESERQYRNQQQKSQAYFQRLTGQNSARTGINASTSVFGQLSDKDFMMYTSGMKSAKDVTTSYSQAVEKAQKEAGALTRVMSGFGKMVGATLAYQTVSNIVSSIGEAVDEMKAVDTEIVNISKVTGKSLQELQRTRDTAYSTASKYGVSASDYLSSAYEFAKAGYADNADALAELATKTMLVGDTTQEVANQFLIAADAAWQWGGDVDKLNAAIDNADYLNNNYATSLQKISEGLPIVAYTSSMAGQEIEQTMAALGTITASTQESGTKAATAYRALLLNIMGNVGEVIDDDLSVTQESVASLTDALKRYAPEAVKAAQETGKIIDPMEAIRGLHQAYKDDLLTDIELEKLLASVGGKLRTNQLTALVKNYEMYEEMLDSMRSGKAIGTADDEISKKLESWESKLQILKNTWTEFLSKSVPTEFIKTVISGLTNLVSNLDNVGTALMIIGGALGIVKAQAIATFAVATGGKIARAVSDLRGFILVVKEFGLASTLTSLLNPAVLAVAAIMAVVTAIGLAIAAYKKWKKEQIETNDTTIAESKKAVEQTKSLEELSKKYDELNQKEKDSADKSKDFIDARNDIAKALLNEGETVESVIKAYKSLDNFISERTKEKAKTSYDSALEGYGAAKQNVGLKGADELGNNFMNAGWSQGKDSTTWVLEYYDDLIKRKEEMIAVGNTENETYAMINSEISKLQPIIDDYNGALENSKEAYLMLMDSQDGIIGNLDDTYSALVDYTGVLEGHKSTLIENQEALAAYGNQLGDAKSDVDTIIAAQQEFNQTGTISEATYLALINVSGIYANALINENGMLDLNGVKLSEVIAKQVEATQKAQAHADAENQVATALANVQHASFAASGAVSQAALAAQNSGIMAAGAAANWMMFWSAMSGGSGGGTVISNMAGSLQGKYKEIQAQKTLNDNKKAAAKTKAEIQKAATVPTSGTPTSPSGSPSKSGGGGSGSKSEKDEELEKLKDIVSLRESELDLLEEQDAPISDRIAKMKEIQEALHNQAEYMRKIGADESDINALSVKWLKTQKEIQKLTRQQYEDERGLLDSQYKLLEKQNGSTAERIALLNKQKDNLHDEADYLRSIGVSQEEINKLSIEWYNIDKEIKDLQEELWNELEKAIDKQLEAAEKQRDAAIEALDAELEALEKQRDTEKEISDLKEKENDLVEKQIALQNALNERSVRYFNGATGKWEWGANASTVKSAQEAVDEAQKAIDEYNADQEYEQRKKEIEERKKAVEDGYDNLKETLKGIVDSIEEPVRDINDILDDIAQNGTPKMKETIESVNIALKNLANYINNTTGNTEESNPSYSDAGYSRGANHSSPSSRVQSIADVVASVGAEVAAAHGITVTSSDGGFVFDDGGILRGMGGIKATNGNEMILNPAITSAMLNPTSDNLFLRRMGELGYLYGATNVCPPSLMGSRGNSIGSQHNGDVYRFGNITMNESQARGTSVYELARMSRSLGVFNNAT